MIHYVRWHICFIMRPEIVLCKQITVKGGKHRYRCCHGDTQPIGMALDRDEFIIIVVVRCYSSSIYLLLSLSLSLYQILSLHLRRVRRDAEIVELNAVVHSSTRVDSRHHVDLITITLVAYSKDGSDTRRPKGKKTRFNLTVGGQCVMRSCRCVRSRRERRVSVRVEHFVAMRSCSKTEDQRTRWPTDTLPTPSPHTILLLTTSYKLLTMHAVTLLLMVAMTVASIERMSHVQLPLHV